MSYDEGNSLLHNSPLLQNIINIDIFVNWNWLTPGGSNTAHIQTKNNTEGKKQLWLEGFLGFETRVFKLKLTVN